jgi:hypothetical protein
VQGGREPHAGDGHHGDRVARPDLNPPPAPQAAAEPLGLADEDDHGRRQVGCRSVHQSTEFFVGHFPVS